MIWPVEQLTELTSPQLWVWVILEHLEHLDKADGSSWMLLAEDKWRLADVMASSSSDGRLCFQVIAGWMGGSDQNSCETALVGVLG